MAARKRICLAEAVAGTLVRVEFGRDRSELTQHLLAEARRDPCVVVGLDFSFSIPEWFARRLGATDARTVWQIVADRGEDWLAEPRPPFWRARRPEPQGPALRRTELDVTEHGIRPKSVFQLVGAGQVGTGSLRGMPYLLELSQTFAVWPFEAPRFPLLVEIYPRLFTRARSKGLSLGRVANEHARDAAASALAMSTWCGDWLRLPREPYHRIEGAIWRPEPPLDSGS